MASLRPTAAGFNTTTGENIQDGASASAASDRLLLDDPAFLAGSTLTSLGGPVGEARQPLAIIASDGSASALYLRL